MAERKRTTHADMVNALNRAASHTQSRKLADADAAEQAAAAKLESQRAATARGGNDD
jgi:hypothetical protein